MERFELDEHIERARVTRKSINSESVGSYRPGRKQRKKKAGTRKSSSKPRRKQQKTAQTTTLGPNCSAAAVAEPAEVQEEACPAPELEAESEVLDNNISPPEHFSDPEDADDEDGDDQDSPLDLSPGSSTDAVLMPQPPPAQWTCCMIAFPSQREKTRHQRAKHRTEICQFCGKLWPKNGINRHEESCTKLLTKLVCNTCPRVFKSHKAILDHRLHCPSKKK